MKKNLYTEIWNFLSRGKKYSYFFKKAIFLIFQGETYKARKTKISYISLKNFSLHFWHFGITADQVACFLHKNIKKPSFAVSFFSFQMFFILYKFTIIVIIVIIIIIIIIIITITIIITFSQIPLCFSKNLSSFIKKS